MGMIRPMSQTATRQLGSVLQGLGLVVLLIGLYFLVGPVWTTVVGGVALLVGGTLLESGLLSARRGRKTGGA